MYSCIVGDLLGCYDFHANLLVFALMSSLTSSLKMILKLRKTIKFLLLCGTKVLTGCQHLNAGQHSIRGHHYRSNARIAKWTDRSAVDLWGVIVRHSVASAEIRRDRYWLNVSFNNLCFFRRADRYRGIFEIIDLDIL